MAQIPSGEVTLTVPDDWQPGMQLSVTLASGRKLSVTVPSGARPGSTICFALGERQHISVTLPPSVEAGQVLAAEAPDGRKVYFQAPANACPGMQLCVALPPRRRNDGFIDVQVPADFTPGGRLSALGPTGETLFIEPPATAQPGTVLRVALPAAAAAGGGGSAGGGAAARQTLRFRLPEGHVPGSSLHVSGPDGRRFSVQTPADAPAGAEVECTVGTAHDSPAADVSAPPGATPYMPTLAPPTLGGQAALGDAGSSIAYEKLGPDGGRLLSAIESPRQLARDTEAAERALAELLPSTWPRAEQGIEYTSILVGFDADDIGPLTVHD